MSYVIDTHIFLWLIFDPDKLSEKMIKTLKNPSHRVYVTSITFWEISLKYNLGKLDLQGISPDELPGVAKQMGIDVIDIEARTMATFHKLPKIDGHKDPFVRIIIWFCISKEFILVSEDNKFNAYVKSGLSNYNSLTQLTPQLPTSPL